MHGCFGELITFMPFIHPALQVCRDLRQRGLAMVAEKCTWVSVNVNTRESAELMEEAMATDIFVIQPIFRRLLPNKIRARTITIRLGDSETRPRTTRQFDDEHTKLLLPYNLSNFHYLLCYIRKFFRETSPILVKIPSVSDTATNTLFETQIYPALRFLSSRHFDLEVEVEGDLELSASLSNQHDSSIPRTIQAMIPDVQFMLDTADKLEELGHDEESDMWLCYYGLILEMYPLYLLPRRYDWEHGESDVDAANTPYTPPRIAGCNVVGVKMRSLVHRLEFRACLGYFLLFRRFGSLFIRSHRDLLTNGRQRWWRETSYPWFGLSDEERSEVHYMRALTRQIKVFAFLPNNTGSAYEPNFSDDEDILVRDPEYEMWHLHSRAFMNPVPDPEDYQADSIRQMKLACTLSPDNEDYQIFYQKLWTYPKSLNPHHNALRLVKSQRKVSGEHLFRYRLPEHIASILGTTHWVGESDMLLQWGGVESLKYLPLAQKRPEEDPE